MVVVGCTDDQVTEPVSIDIARTRYAKGRPVVSRGALDDEPFGGRKIGQVDRTEAVRSAVDYISLARVDCSYTVP